MVRYHADLKFADFADFFGTSEWPTEEKNWILGTLFLDKGEILVCGRLGEQP